MSTQDVNAGSELKKWVEGLPLLNISKASSMMYEKLRSLRATTPDDLPLYFQYIEMLHQPLDTLCASIKENYLFRSQISSMSKIKVHGLVQVLQLEMANAYVHWLNNVIAWKIDKINQQTLGLALFRAMSYLAESVLLCYEMYYPMQEGAWLELHGLYTYARSFNLKDLEVSDEMRPKTIKMTIQGVYKRILLLAIANPYKLQRDEIENLYEALAMWAEQLEFKGNIGKEDLFVIDTSKNEPPLYQQFSTQDLNSSTCFGLDTTKIRNNLKTLLSNPLLQSKQSIPPNLLRYLMQAWGEFLSRAYQRDLKAGAVKVCIGLGATHHYLSGKSLGVEAVSEENKTETHYKIYDWQVVDNSASGYGIYAILNMSEEIKIGELTGLVSKDADGVAHWEVGVICWMKYTADGKLHLGVQLLGVDPAAISIQSPGLAQDKYLSALLLPEVSDLGQKQSLITHNLPYVVGIELGVINKGLKSKVKLTNEILIAGLYKRFQFEG